MNTKIGLILRLNQVARQLSSAARGQKNYYELLGIGQEATAAEIKLAYYEKTKLYHPDVVPPTEENLRIFRQISEAYEILGSGPSRKEYDENVLGLVKEGGAANAEDDPIAAYKRRVAGNSASYSWTRDYCEQLRRQQSGGPSASVRARAEVKQNSSAVPGFSVFCLCILVFIAGSVYPSFSDIKKTQHKQ